MNIALNVLLNLVKYDVNSVAVYSVFVKGILDYLDNLNLYQIRTLFDIFSLLALTVRANIIILKRYPGKLTGFITKDG